MFTTPGTQWYRFIEDRGRRAALAEAVSGEVAPHATIANLQDFWQLSGATGLREKCDALAVTATVDVAAARMLEPHIDALTILTEAGAAPAPPHSSWGVFAAEAPGTTLAATPGNGDRVELSGVKPWCSLAADVTHAIVTAHRGADRQAFAVDLGHPGVRPTRGGWPSRGLHEIPSTAVEFEGVPATAVGPPRWYLERPGFSWGGIRVAACWLGGAIGLAQNAARRHVRRTSTSAVADMCLGRIDAEIFAARTVIAQAISLAGQPAPSGQPSTWALALRVRNIVAGAAQRIQALSRELAGPAALTGDESFAKADADLTVYLSQHHGHADEAALGAELTNAGSAR